MGEIIHLDTAEVKKQLGEMVLGTVEQMLNAMPDAEADEITQAHKYERTESRADTRARHYHRALPSPRG
jgi:putative transposase